MSGGGGGGECTTGVCGGLNVKRRKEGKSPSEREVAIHTNFFSS